MTPALRLFDAGMSSPRHHAQALELRKDERLGRRAEARLNHELAEHAYQWAASVRSHTQVQVKAVDVLRCAILLVQWASK